MMKNLLELLTRVNASVIPVAGDRARSQEVGELEEKSLADDLDEDAFGPVAVELAVEDLLPAAEVEFEHTA